MRGITNTAFATWLERVGMIKYCEFPTDALIAPDLSLVGIDSTGSVGVGTGEAAEPRKARKRIAMGPL